MLFLQSDDSAESIKSDAQEKDGGKCEFDKYLEGLRLWPTSFIYRSMVAPLEKSRHSFAREAAGTCGYQIPRCYTIAVDPKKPNQRLM